MQTPRHATGVDHRQDAVVLQASNPARPGSLQSADLFKGTKTIEINHNNEIYRLQTTRLGKLILTK